VTVNLLQLDEAGQEQITSIFMSDEDRETLRWLYSLEAAASGTTIFVHRLSDYGHYLCTVPCTHKRFAGDPKHPVRYCGCYDCIDQRNYLKNYTARAIILDMEGLIGQEFLYSKLREQSRSEKGLTNAFHKQ